LALAGNTFWFTGLDAAAQYKMGFRKRTQRQEAEVKRIVKTAEAPKAVGPYSQAVVAGGFVFCCGQGPLDPATGQVAGSDTAAQTERVLKNLAAVLEASGSSLERVVKTTVFLKNLNDFTKMNEVFAKFFPSAPPARSTIEAARLPLDTLVEIEAIATVG
jgi:2-iminobutanoate/2-iminopropanoate deaminase